MTVTQDDQTAGAPSVSNAEDLIAHAMARIEDTRRILKKADDEPSPSDDADYDDFLRQYMQNLIGASEDPVGVPTSVGDPASIDDPTSVDDANERPGDLPQDPIATTERAVKCFATSETRDGISAMRDVANDNTRTAILRSLAAQIRKARRNCLYTLACLVPSIAVLMLDLQGVSLVAGCLAAIAAVFTYRRYSITTRPFKGLKVGKESRQAPSDGPTGCE